MTLTPAAVRLEFTVADSFTDVVADGSDADVQLGDPVRRVACPLKADGHAAEPSAE